MDKISVAEKSVIKKYKSAAVKLDEQKLSRKNTTPTSQAAFSNLFRTQVFDKTRTNTFSERLSAFDMDFLEEIDESKRMLKTPAHTGIKDLNYPHKKRQKRISKLWIELACLSIYQLVIIVLLLTYYDKDKICCLESPVDGKTPVSGISLSKWLLTQALVDMFSLVRVVLLVIMFRRASDPKKLEVILYLVQVCVYWSFLSYWSYVGASMVYANEGMRTCWTQNPDVMPLVRLAQVMLFLDFCLCFMLVMLLPVILTSFVRVIRQRIRICLHECKQPINDTQHKASLDLCQTKQFTELAAENAHEMARSACYSRCQICLDDFKESD